jgi:hypothetical protein
MVKSALCQKTFSGYILYLKPSVPPSGWQEVKVDIFAYRGQKIRIYFNQRLDGFGDQLKQKLSLP